MIKKLRTDCIFWHRRCKTRWSTVKSLRNSSILVVEDDASLLRAIERVLTNEGAVVTGASWAAEAMAELADPQNRFDLIITDLHMPCVRASTIIKMIKQRFNSETRQPISVAEGKVAWQGVRTLFPGVPIIAMTAFCSPEVEADCFREGASALLEKPLSTQQLLAAIKSVFASQKDWPPNDRLQKSIEKGVNYENVKPTTTTRTLGTELKRN